jgi:phosphatidylserine decarboxylase
MASGGLGKIVACLPKIMFICFLKRGDFSLTYIYRFFIELSNHLLLSKIIQHFTRSKLSKALLLSYVRVFKINLDEVEKPLCQYDTLQEFFTRKLKKEARSLSASDKDIISPVDGTIVDYGTIANNKIIEVKGKEYSIEDMLYDSSSFNKYIGGQYIVLYLSPSDYHRIHSPVTGTVTVQKQFGLHSYPVNKLGLKYGKKTLSNNFRVWTEVVHPKGSHISVVKVGAMFINSIEVTHENDCLTIGEEMAYFSFGSTVILLFEKDGFSLQSFKNESTIQVGQLLGSIRQGS